MTYLCADWKEGDDEPCGDLASARFDITISGKRKKLTVYKCTKHATALHRRLSKSKIVHVETLLPLAD